MVLHIIESRVSNKQNKTASSSKKSNTCENINKLPSSMIQYCSEFLTTKDYVSYQKCSRFIYISCNKPSKLQCLNIINKDIDSSGSRFCLNKFPFLKSLKLSVSSFNRYINSNCNHINNLTHLEALCISDRSTSRQIKKFMNIKCINFDSIQFLKCEKLGGTYSSLDFDTFCEFLSKFTNLKSLEINNNVNLSSYNDENKYLSQLFPKLQILHIFNKEESVCLFQSKLLNLYSSQIISLAYNEKINPIKIYSDSTKVEKLTEILVDHPNMNTLNNIIDRSNLEKISILLRGARGWIEEQTKNVINKILTKCKQLKYLELYLNYNQFEKIIHSAQISLFLLKKHKRRAFKIFFYVNKCDVAMETVIAMILQFANTLDMLKINDFMILFYFEGNINLMDKETEKAIIKKLEEHYLIFTNVSTEKLHVVVSNKDCKMNGREADWTQYYHLT